MCLNQFSIFHSKQKHIYANEIEMKIRSRWHIFMSRLSRKKYFDYHAFRIIFGVPQLKYVYSCIPALVENFVRHMRINFELRRLNNSLSVWTNE